MKHLKKALSTVLIISIVFLSANIYSNDGFKLWDRNITFGTSIENFSVIFPEFSIDSELSTNHEKVMSYKITNVEYEIKEMTLSVYFRNNSLNEFILHSNISDGSDQPQIDEIVNQFKYVPPKDKIDEDEIGDIVVEYRKGNLTALAFAGGFYRLTITLN